MAGLHENCYDCAEFYHACRGWPAAKDWACADFLNIPTVGVQGATGMKLPDSRMGGRTEPRATDAKAAEKHRRPDTGGRHEQIAASPAATIGSDGIRRCNCGKAIPPGKRCCEECREFRRQKTMERHHAKPRRPRRMDSNGVNV